MGARLLRGLLCSRRVTGNMLCVVKLYDVFAPVESYPPPVLDPRLGFRRRCEQSELEWLGVVLDRLTMRIIS